MMFVVKIEILGRAFHKSDVGCPPNTCSYNVFVQGLLPKRDFLRSRKYLQIMKGKGFAEDATSCL
jgi:hypothetical protein